MDDAEYARFISKITTALREQTLPFAQQVATLQEIVQANFETAPREKIVDDLSACLSPAHPEIKIHFFGSAELDLEIPGSTLDIYVANVRLRTTNELTSLRILQTVITRHAKFDDIFVIAGNHPHIRCRHVATETACVLSLHERVVRSTALVKYYLSLDPKIRLLMLVLKVWARCHGLLGKQGFSNYVLYHLVIFYLQQNPYRVPGVMSLREEQNIWTCIHKNLRFVALESATIFELVSGFLKFYDGFDYISHVVAPFCGLALDKTCFLEPYLLPPCYSSYMAQKKTLAMDCGLCVQDPLDHSSNFLLGTPLTSGGKLASQCRDSLVTRDCPFLATLLCAQKRQHFVINKLEGFSDDEWTTSVRKVTSSVLDSVCGLQLRVVAIKPSHYLYSCGGTLEGFWKDRVTILNGLLPKMAVSASEICKEIDVTTNYMKTRMEHDMKARRVNFVIEAKFEKNPCRVEFFLKRLEGDTHFEQFFRVKVLVFLKEVVARNCLSVVTGAKIAQGTFMDLKVMVNALIQTDETFSEQVTALQYQLMDYTQNTETIRNELTSALLPWFPDSNVRLATANLDLLNSFLHVCIDGIHTQNSAMPLIQNIIRQSDKFDNTKILSVKEMRCRHTKTQTLCHITVDKLASERARMVEYYMNLDEKVYSLLVLVSYWAHCHNVVGVDRQSTYSLCLLVIFYLQQEPYKLPAVADLREDVNLEISALRNATILELANGFFRFYDSFDYLYYVVAPFCGYAVEKTRFVKPYELPSCFSGYTKREKHLGVTMSMCVQDPCEHSRNVLQGAGIQCGGYFASICRRSVIDSPDECLLLYKLLNFKALRPLSVLKSDDCCVDDWVSRLDTVASEVLTKILAFTVEKEWKPSFHQITYKCVGKFEIWRSRLQVWKALMPKLPVGVSEMQKEIAVSSRIRAKSKTQIAKNSISVDLCFKVDPHRVEVVVRGYDMPCRRLDVEQFLRLKLGKFMEEYVRDKIGDISISEDSLDCDSSNSAHTPPRPPLRIVPFKIKAPQKQQKTKLKFCKLKRKIYYVRPRPLRALNPPSPTRCESSNMQKPKSDARRSSSSNSRRSRSSSRRRVSDIEEQSRSRSRSYDRNITTKKPKRFRNTIDDSSHRDRSFKRSKTRSRSRSRSSARNKDAETPPRRSSSREQSRSRSRSCGRNSNEENVKAKKPKRSQKSSSSDSRFHSDGSRFERNKETKSLRRNQRRKRSNDSKRRSRSRESRRNQSSKRDKPKRNQRSSSGDSHRSRLSHTPLCSPPKESRKELFEQRRTFLEEVREKLREISKPVVPSVPFPYDVPICRVPAPSPVTPAPSFAKIVPSESPISAPPLYRIQAANFQPQDVILPDRGKSEDQQVPNPIDQAVAILLANIKSVGLSQVLREINTSSEVALYTTSPDKVQDEVQSQRKKLMLRSLEACRVMTTRIPKRFRFIPPPPDSKVPIHPSPLRRSQVDLRFTSQMKRLRRFEEILLDILRCTGFCNEPNDISKLMESVAEVLKSGVAADKTTAARILQISLLGAMEHCKSRNLVEVGTQSSPGRADKQVGTEGLKVVLRDPRTYGPKILGRGGRGVRQTNRFFDDEDNALELLQWKEGYEEKIFY